MKSEKKNFLAKLKYFFRVFPNRRVHFVTLAHDLVDLLLAVIIDVDVTDRV